MSQFQFPIGALQRRPGGRVFDPRQIYANALISNGVDTSPIQSPIQGLARMASAGVGAYLANQVQGDEKQRQDAYVKALMEGVQAGQGKPAETKDYRFTTDEQGQRTESPTTINWDPVKPDTNRMVSAWASNPDTAPMAAEYQTKQIEAQQAEARQRAQQRQVLVQHFQQQGLNAVFDDAGNVVGTTQIPDFGKNKGQVAAAEARPMIGVKVEEQDAMTPGAARRAGAVADAQVPAAVNQHTQTTAIDVANAGPRAEATAAGTLRAQNAPVDTPTGPVPAGAAADIAKAQAKEIAERASKVADIERKWRQELNKPITEAADLAKQNQVIQTALQKADGTGDIAAITAFNKLLDPGAVVREADVALTLAAQGLADKMEIWMKNKQTGDILPPDLRRRMGELAQQIFQTSGAIIKDRIVPYQDSIKTEGGSFDNVVPPQLRKVFGWDQPDAPPVAPPPGTKTPLPSDRPPPAPAVPVAQPPATPTPAQASDPKRPASEQEYNALPKGAMFYDPDGNLRVKP